jgi:uncharacterized caspase-like protein
MAWKLRYLSVVFAHLFIAVTLAGCGPTQLVKVPEVLDTPRIPLHAGLYMSPNVLHQTATIGIVKFQVGRTMEEVVNEQCRRAFLSLKRVNNFPWGRDQVEGLDVILVIDRKAEVKGWISDLTQWTAKGTGTVSIYSPDHRLLNEYTETNSAKLNANPLAGGERVKEVSREGQRLVTHAVVSQCLHKFARSETALAAVRRADSGRVASERPAAPKHSTISPSPVAKAPPPPSVTATGISKRFAVAVGINAYQYRGKWSLMNLRYAARDAEALARHLQSEKGGRFDRVILLTDRDATTRNLKIALREELRGVQEGDFVVIFWAGHGSPDPHDPKSLYLLTYDTDPEHMASTAYSMEEFKTDVGRLRANRVLVLADACHSAGVSDPRMGLRGDRPNKIVEGIRGVHVKPGSGASTAAMRMIFTSCETGETSREDSELGEGHGVFTFFLLQALKGEADLPGNAGNGDGRITLGEVIEYTRDQVKRYTGNQQHPDTAGRFDRGVMMGTAR